MTLLQKKAFQARIKREAAKINNQRRCAAERNWEARKERQSQGVINDNHN